MESINGVNWIRKDKKIKFINNLVGENKMRASNIVELKGDTFMFYNGNDMRKRGFCTKLEN